MIKSLTKDDISSYPFVVSKEWDLPIPSNNFLLADINLNISYGSSSFVSESSDHTFISESTEIISFSAESSTLTGFDSTTSYIGATYTDFGYGLSVNCFSQSSEIYFDKSVTESKDSKFNYPSPFRFYHTSSEYSPVVNESFKILLEDDENQFLKIEEGIKVEKYIRFDTGSELRNYNNSYKRLIYDQIKNLYYNDSKDPTKLLGLENIDLFLDGANRIINDQIKVVTIPQAYFGDSIQKESVEILDDSWEVPSTIVDDGISNLITRDKTFVKVVSDERRTSSLNPNFGYSVSNSDEYSAISSPSFDSDLTKTGSVDVYRYNTLISDRFIYDKTLYLQSESLDFLGSDVFISQSDFGRSVSCYGSLLAVSTTKLTFTSSGITYTTGGFINIYDLTSTSSLPIQTITHSQRVNEETQSFGWDISMNENYLIVGSPFSETSGEKGCVYLYNSSSLGFVYEDVISASNQELFFGSKIEIDKKFNKFVVGTISLLNPTSSVYLFESSSVDGWAETYNFNINKTDADLFFLEGVKPYYQQNNTIDGFGNSVSIYCSGSDGKYITVAIGAPFDRNILEYSGSDCYRNGAVYIFEKNECIDPISESLSSSYWKTTRLIGDNNNFHSNRFGHSLSIYNDTIVISSPKYISEYTSSYIKNTLHHSPIDEEYYDYDYNGMIYIYKKEDSNWNVEKSYKPKKLPNNPYRFFGFDVSLFNNNLTVGNPIPIVDGDFTSIDSIDFDFYGTNVSSSFNGNFRIFDMRDLNITHHVGNVFYKTGRIVLSNTGSVFDNIFENSYNDIPSYNIKYNSVEKLYEKEIICSLGAGEFNYSTNPTSYSYTSSLLDLNSNGKFDFEDCDLILRSLYKNITHGSSEEWWNLFNNFEDRDTFESDVESSLFEYYVSSSFKNKSHVTLRSSILTNSQYNYIIDNLKENLDITQDGKTDENDIKILWKYFINKLTYNNLSTYLNSNSKKKDFDYIIGHLNTISGKNNLPYVKAEFLNKNSSSFTTGSTLSPYITTIGLYNGLDLIGVAKLGTPIKHEGNFPLNFIIRFDI